ncbi:hypothetical protein [Pelagibacterium sediminicola]|nr:hypothetical protein [Pelagibacterium sediminicola]
MVPVGLSYGIFENGGMERKARVFALDLPHSYACYVRAYPAAVSQALACG